MKRSSVFAVLVGLLLALLGGCNGSGGSGPQAIYETTSLTLRAGDASSSALSAQPLAFAGSFADVTAVRVTVSGEDRYGVEQNPLASADLTRDGNGVWSVTIPNLPIGPTLSFTANGLDASGTVLFTGTATTELTGNGDIVAVAMAPVSDGAQLLFPVVQRVTLPGNVVVSSEAGVSVDVKGSAGEVLTFAFTAQDGTFAPATGSLTTASSGMGTINSVFSAPDSPGALTQSVQVTNRQNNSVVTDFPVQVIYDQTNLDIHLGFAPVITGILGRRTGNDVTWTATVNDDGPASALVYSWAFVPDDPSSSASFSTANANPGVLSGYDESLSGTVSLTVTDGDNLSTTVTFALPAGQFPNTVMVFGQSDEGFVAGFAPVVTSFQEQRSGSTVSWTATATDDGPADALRYAWAFSQSGGTPGAVFSASQGNPGVLSGYDTSVTGTVALTVTDGDGLSTTVTFALQAGQFPDVVTGTSP